MTLKSENWNLEFQKGFEVLTILTNLQKIPCCPKRQKCEIHFIESIILQNVEWKKLVHSNFFWNNAIKSVIAHDFKIYIYKEIEIIH